MLANIQNTVVELLAMDYRSAMDKLKELKGANVVIGVFIEQAYEQGRRAQVAKQVAALKHKQALERETAFTIIRRLVASAEYARTVKGVNKGVTTQPLDHGVRVTINGKDSGAGYEITLYYSRFTGNTLLVNGEMVLDHCPFSIDWLKSAVYRAIWVNRYSPFSGL